MYNSHRIRALIFIRVSDTRSPVQITNFRINGIDLFWTTQGMARTSLQRDASSCSVLQVTLTQYLHPEAQASKEASEEEEHFITDIREKHRYPNK